MKLTVVCLLLCLLRINASTYSQKTKISLNVKNTSIELVLFNRIEKSTDFKFFYENTSLDLDKRVTIKVRKQPIKKVLDLLFAGTNIDYEIVDKQIVLTHRTSRPAKLIKTKTVLKTGQMSLQREIHGTVTDTDGAPLPGASIVEKGTTNGTQTDFDGNFTLETADKDAILVVSYIGFETKEITVGEQTTFSISLDASVSSLDAVVVVGYGSVKKSDLTGAVSSIKSSDLNTYPTADPVSALQGRSSGILIQSNNGGPGSSTRVRIRGGTSINSSSDPLFVVDGFPSGSMPPAEDIESIEVLKDASATAIYGSRGANGVVLVTTKNGKVGKAVIELNTSYSSQTEIGRYDLLKANDFISYINEVAPGSYDPNVSYQNTDWQDKILQVGQIKNTQLAVSGGTDMLKYYVSAIAYDTDGIIVNSDYKRYSLTSNLEAQLTDNLKMGVNIFGISSTTNGVPTQELSGGGSGTGVISSALKMEPTVGIYNEDGSFALSKIADPFDNAYAIATQRTDELALASFQGNVFFDWKIAEPLTWRSSYGYKFTSQRRGKYAPTTINEGANVNGQASQDIDRSTKLVTEQYLTFNKVFNDKHDFTLLGGYSYESNSYEDLYVVTSDFISDSFLFWNLDGGANRKSTTSELTESELMSFYGRLNYKFSDRYLFTFTARYDGSSKFAKNNKWAFFPSAAVAWNVKEETFMQDVSAISQLKLRGSYGMTGSQSIDAYQSLARLSTINSTIIGGNPVNAVAIGSVANDDLTWEKTKQLDVGVDFGLFNQRIGLTADYYTMETKDQLFRLPLPQYSGYSDLLKNVGVVGNKGFEIGLTTVNLDGKFSWTTDFNFSKNKNTILELPDGNDIFLSTQPGHMVGMGSTQVLREGESVGTFYGYIYDGVIQKGDATTPGSSFEQEAGGEKFRDVNGRDNQGELTGLPDGQLNNDDKTIIGDPNPDFTIGLNNTFKYKGFDLNVFLYTSQGNDIYSYTLLELDLMSGTNNATTNALNRWTPTNTNTDVPKAGVRSLKSSDRFVYDGSFIRLKNLALGYTIPKQVIKKIGITNARIYISGQNLFTITDYPGVDPEVNYRTGDGAAGNTNLGFDYGSYPNTKSYTLGAQIKF